MELLILILLALNLIPKDREIQTSNEDLKKISIEYRSDIERYYKDEYQKNNPDEKVYESVIPQWTDETEDD